MVVTEQLSNTGYISIKLGKTHLKALLDSGSNYSLISWSLAVRLKLQVLPLAAEDNKCLFSASGSRLEIIGKTKVTIGIGLSGYCLQHELFVIKEVNEPILLGRIFLENSGAVINFREGIVIFNNILEIPLHANYDKTKLLRITESLFLPEGAEALCLVSAHKKYNSETVMVTPIEDNQFKRIAIANSVNIITNGKTYCRILNCLDLAYLVFE